MLLRPPLLALLLLCPTDHNWTVTLRSFGPLRFGMSVAEASRLSDTPLTRQNPGSGEGCDYADSPALPTGSSLMVWEDSIIVRVDVTAPGVATRSGIQVGSTEAEVRRAYPGSITNVPNPYDDANPLLDFRPTDPADSAFGIVFETGAGKVTSYRAGRHAAVELVEGCS